MSHSQLNAMLTESGMEDEACGALAAALESLAGMADETSIPTTELLALFGERDLVLPVRPMVGSSGGRGSGVAAGALVLALSCVGATGLSAAANTLPSPLQQHVSEFSRRYLPFEFPQPAAQLPHLPRPPQVRQGAPSRDGNGRGELDGAAPDAERDHAVSRSLEQPRTARPSVELSRHRSARPTDRPSARTSREDDRTDRSPAPGPQDPDQPEPTASAPSQPNSSSSPQPESRPAVSKPSAGVPVNLAGSGEHHGLVGPKHESSPGGAKKHANAVSEKTPWGYAPVMAPSESPVSGPAREPLADQSPDPENVTGGNPTRHADGPATAGVGGPADGPAAAGVGGSAVEGDSSGQVER